MEDIFGMGKFGFQSLLKNLSHYGMKKLPDLGRAYLLNCFLPGFGNIYLGKILSGILVFLGCLFFALIFFNLGNFIFATLLYILNIADTRGEYSRCIKRLID